MVRLAWFFAFLLAGSNGWAQTSLSRRQAVEDIDAYVRIMKSSHYHPFMYIPEGEYNTRLQAIKNEIGDSVSIRDFVFLFYKVTALLKDAHSTPQLGQPVFREAFGKEQFFPYKLVQKKNKMYAPLQLAAALGMPAGVEVVDINGVDVSALFKQVKERLAGRPSFSEAAACRLFSYFLFLRGVQPPFALTCKDAKGIQSKATIQTGVTFKNALAASLPHIVQPYRCEVIQNKLGYIDVRSLSVDINGFRAFLDSCFTQLKQASIRHLAIDLRQNSGGNTDLGDLLFSYITRNKYSWGNKSWKISDAYKDNLRKNGDTTTAYMQRPNGTVWESADGCRPEENRFRNERVFEGKVYFITGPFTFSSAMAVADVVKEYKIATLIGEPTGENTQDFGEAFTIDLPNSQLKIQSTTSFSHGASCGKTKNGPVLPDVVIRNSLKDDVLEEDPALAYLLRLIQ
ncbi:S41 family peptidase [Chitinophaga sp.]|uniref:S41 family peptidase n=1 Tax=Chitinophaga sp. TaxID=1869181 RepID=UPI0031D65CFC